MSTRNYNPKRAGASKQEQDDKQLKTINSIDEIPKNMSDDEAADFWSTHAMSEDLLEKQIIKKDNLQQEHFESPIEEVKESPQIKETVKMVVIEDIVLQPVTDYPNPISEADKIAPYTPKQPLEKEQSQKAVYDVQRTPDGINLTHVDKKEDHYIDVKNRKINTIKEMIINTEKEINKIELEIEIHTILEKESKSEQEHNMNIRRLESFRTNYEYLQKKLNIALGMIK